MFLRNSTLLIFYFSFLKRKSNPAIAKAPTKPNRLDEVVIPVFGNCFFFSAFFTLVTSLLVEVGVGFTSGVGVGAGFTSFSNTYSYTTWVEPSFKVPLSAADVDEIPTRT